MNEIPSAAYLVAGGIFVTVYPIIYTDREVGTAKVFKEGLFYRISCVCNMGEDSPFRVSVIGENDVDLGLCVPMEKNSGMEIRIPIKRVGKGILRFQAMPKVAAHEECVMVSPEVPFDHIIRLKDAYLIKQGQLIGICFRSSNQSPSQPGNDQNP